MRWIMSEDKLNKKTRAELKREQIEKTKADLDRLQKEAKRLEAAEKKSAAQLARTLDNRMKNHIGGSAKLAGLLNYVYSDKSLHDNRQDALIENLIVGVFWRASQTLSNATVAELKSLYELGQAIRNMEPDKRDVPEVNKSLNEFFDILRQNKSNITDTKGEQNGDDVGDSLIGN